MAEEVKDDTPELVQIAGYQSDQWTRLDVLRTVVGQNGIVWDYDRGCYNVEELIKAADRIVKYVEGGGADVEG